MPGEIPPSAIFVPQVLLALQGLADPVQANAARRYFKTAINNLGVSNPKIEALEKELCGPWARQATPEQALDFCEQLLRLRVYEASIFGLYFLSRFSKRLPAQTFDRAEEWLEADLLDSWAAVDTLAPRSLGPVLDREPWLGDTLRRWTRSGNRWTRRAAAVTLVLQVRRGKHLGLAYDIAFALHTDTDDLVQKAAGWILRDSGVTDPARLEGFVRAHGRAMPRTMLRYAIEKFPESLRKELLSI